MNSENFNTWLVADLKNLLLQYDITNKDIQGTGKNGNVVKKDYIKTIKKIINNIIKFDNNLDTVVWHQILLNLPYQELQKVYMVNMNALNACQNNLFWIDKFKIENLPLKEPYPQSIAEWIKYYKTAYDNKHKKYYVIAEGGSMSSEYFTDTELYDNKVRILAHYRLFWDDYEQWPQSNKNAVKNVIKGKIIEGEGRVAVTYKVTNTTTNKVTLYDIVNPQHLFSYLDKSYFY